jgi:hypothetical protein
MPNLGFTDAQFPLVFMPLFSRRSHDPELIDGSAGLGEYVVHDSLCLVLDLGKMVGPAE